MFWRKSYPKDKSSKDLEESEKKHKELIDQDPIEPQSNTRKRLWPNREVHERCLAIGHDLFERSKRSKSNRGVFQDQLMKFAMSNDTFRAQLFRFIDLYPRLQSDDDVYEILRAYLKDASTPSVLTQALKAGGLAKGLVNRVVRESILNMATTFIVGETIEDAQKGILRAAQKGWLNSIDLLGEKALSPHEAKHYRDEYLAVIASLAHSRSHRKKDLEASQRHRKHTFGVPNDNVSIKLSSLYAPMNSIAFDEVRREMFERLKPLLDAAAKNEVTLNFDMEHEATKELTIALFKDALQYSSGHLSIAIQAYLKSIDDDIADLVQWVQTHKKLVTVRIIKGAYWDAESLEAKAKGWPSPCWENKHESDAAFERALKSLFEAAPREKKDSGILVAAGTHNLRSIAMAIALRDEMGLHRDTLEFQMLYGMADEFKEALSSSAERVREYMPVGDMIVGMSYLVRRLLENTSNQGWLLSREKEDDHDKLFESPHLESESEPPSERNQKRLEESYRNRNHGIGDFELNDFHNVSPFDFSKSRVRNKMRKTLAKIESVRPKTSTTHADEEGVQVALAKFSKSAKSRFNHSWIQERAACLMRVAAAFEENKMFWCALLIKKGDKTWRDADGEVCEAIDFCRYYARQALALSWQHKLTSSKSESHHLLLRPIGNFAAIAPWNFPLAILCGISLGPWVCGNNLLLKPAEQRTQIAAHFMDCLRECGVDESSFVFVPGSGEKVGRALVESPDIHGVTFTGSLEVGLSIMRSSHEQAQKHGFFKKLVVELGGKNAMYIDRTADLDEAIPAIIASAFGYAGQKCSACSRLYIDDTIFDVCLERLRESMHAWRVGDPIDPSIDMGPLVDAKAREKFMRYRKAAYNEGKVIFEGQLSEGLLSSPRAYVAPLIAVFEDENSKCIQDEIFGPLLSVIRVKDYDDAKSRIHASKYQLTAGIFSRDPRQLEDASHSFLAGNLYINRSITGAEVHKNPFGGHGLSGVGYKAGGPHYLKQFVKEHSITENMMRQGFSPDE